MSVTINKTIRVTGEAPFVETFATSNSLVYVTNVVQTAGVGYSDYNFDVVYPDSSYVQPTTITMNVTSACGNSNSYGFSESSPCGSYAVSSIIKDTSVPYRFSVTTSNTSCSDITYEWEYNKALFNGVVSNRGLKSTLNLSLREDLPITSFNTGYKVKVTGTDCSGCSDVSEASYSFCKASFNTINKNIVPTDTTEFKTIYDNLNVNGYYVSKADGTLGVVTQPIADQNKIMLIAIEATEFTTNDSCFSYDPKNIKFDIITKEYDVEYLGYTDINSYNFHVFVAHNNYQEYYSADKFIEIQYTVESEERIEAYPAKIVLSPQAEVIEEITISFNDSQFITKDGITSPLDGSIVDVCGYDNTDVLYISPKISLSISSNAYLDTSGATYGVNFFSTTDSRLSVVPAPNSTLLSTPFLFKYTFDDTVANTVPLVIPYTLHVTSKADDTVKAYQTGNLTLTSTCTSSVTLTQNTLSLNVSCADYDDGTYDNIIDFDLADYVSGTFTPSGIPVVVDTLPTQGTLQTYRNSTKVRFIADLCQDGVFTAIVRLRDVNGVESVDFTVTYNVDCVGKDYYTRFCNIE